MRALPSSEGNPDGQLKNCGEISYTKFVSVQASSLQESTCSLW